MTRRDLIALLGTTAASWPRYRINRQLSGWIPPPLMIRAFGAHYHIRTHALQQMNCDDLFDHLVSGSE
jgi:hypothetical protein